MIECPHVQDIRSYRTGKKKEEDTMYSQPIVTN